MSILILGDSFTFPEGNAATNRVYTYAKGFIENGVNVHVICLGNEYITDYDGIIDGINYYHPFGQTKRSNYFIVRRWQKLMKYFRTIALIRQINKADNVAAINIWTQNISTQLFVFILAKSYKIKLILERSEHPLRYYKNSKFDKIYGNLKLALEIKLCDALFCISGYLVEFYKSRGFNPENLFLVPGTVDPGRFKTHFNSPFPFSYILYCGSLTILKDGVNVLIESFSKIAEKYPELYLVLIGKGDSLPEEKNLRELTSSLNIDEKVIFTGQLSRTEIPAYLCNAKALALARPQSLIADAGFPSKLTEYLATGKPVLVTRVGEIPVYLKDKENAFLSEPDSVIAFADKLDYIFSNYDFALQVGKEGKELTETVFNYKFQAERMIGFIDSLKNNQNLQTDQNFIAT